MKEIDPFYSNTTFKKLSVCTWPLEGESLSSWLSRFATLQGFPSIRSFLRVPPFNCKLEKGYDADRLLPRKLQSALERRSGFYKNSLRSWLFREIWIMHEKYRTAICPLCWLDDIHHGRPVYRRRIWARPLYLCCALHNVPMLDVVELPESPAKAVRLLEPLIHKLMPASPVYSDIVRCMTSLDRFLYQMRGENSVVHHVGLLRALAELLDHGFGPWRGKEAAGERLWLYRVEKKGALSWDLMFGSPLAPERQTEPGTRNRKLSFRKISSVGYRRQLVYAAFDLLLMADAGAIKRVSYLRSGERKLFENVLSYWPHREWEEWIKFARTIMPSRAPDACRRPLDKSRPDAGFLSAFDP